MPAMGSAGPMTRSRVARESEWKAVQKAAAAGPLQSLTDAELDLGAHPVTIYPPGRQQRVRAWVRFGPTPVRVHAHLMRSTPLAAGIEFSAADDSFRCWVWGNAIELIED